MPLLLPNQPMAAGCVQPTFCPPFPPFLPFFPPILSSFPPCPPAVSIYNMKDPKSSTRGVVLLHTMPNKQVTSLHWSPSGRFLLLAGMQVRRQRGGGGGAAPRCAALHRCMQCCSGCALWRAGLPLPALAQPFALPTVVHNHHSNIPPNNKHIAIHLSTLNLSATSAKTELNPTLLLLLLPHRRAGTTVCSSSGTPRR